MAGSPSFPTPSARLAALGALPLSDAERAALLERFAELSRSLEALAAFAGDTDEPATGFDPLLGEEAP